jgi:hypothetical protein
MNEFSVRKIDELLAQVDDPDVDLQELAPQVADLVGEPEPQVETVVLDTDTSEPEAIPLPAPPSPNLPSYPSFVAWRDAQPAPKPPPPVTPPPELAGLIEAYRKAVAAFDEAQSVYGAWQARSSAASLAEARARTMLEEAKADFSAAVGENNGAAEEVAKHQIREAQTALADAFDLRIALREHEPDRPNDARVSATRQAALGRINETELESLVIPDDFVERLHAMFGCIWLKTWTGPTWPEFLASIIPEQRVRSTEAATRRLAEYGISL